MRSTIVCTLAICVVALAILGFILTDDRTPDQPIRAVNVSVESGAVSFRNGTQTQTIHPGEQVTVHRDGSMTLALSRTTPAPPDIEMVTAPPLPPALVSLALSVRDTEGNPVSEATATIRQGSQQHIVRLGQDGSGVVEQLRAGNVDITVFDPFILAGCSTQAVLEKGANEIRMVVARRSSYCAFLKNKKYEPVTKAIVTLSPKTDVQKIKEADLSQRSPGKNGFFLFDPVVSGEYLLSVIAPPYLPHEETVTARRECHPGTIILSEGARITVMVESDERKPIGGAHVTLRSAPGSGNIVVVNQTNDLTGITAFEDIPPGDYHVSAEHPWFYDRGKGEADVQVRKSRHEVRLTLASRTYRISGRVYEKESGEPIKGAEVVAIADREIVPKSVSAVNGRAPDAKAVTKNDGTYVLEGLRGGTYIVGVSPRKDYITIPLSEEMNFGAPNPVRVLLGEEQDVSGVDFPLLLPWVVSGRVLLSDGSPVGGASVYPCYFYQSIGGGGGYSSAWSDESVLSEADGTYRYVGTRYVFNERTQVKMIADHPLYQRSEDVVVLPEAGKEISGVDLVYDQRGIVSGSVRDEKGLPVSGAKVLFWDNAEMKSIMTDGSRQFNFHTILTKADGSFRLALKPGTYLSRAVKDGYVHVDRDEPVIVKEGVERSQIDFILERGDESFEGWASEEDGRPIAGLRVRLGYVLEWEPGKYMTSTVASTLTDENGRFRLVASDVYGMTLFRIYTVPTKIYKRAEFETEEWGAKNIRLIIERHGEEYGSIAGVVQDENHSAVSPFDVRIIPSQTAAAGWDFVYTWRTVTNPDGAFLFERVPIVDGPFLVVAKSEDSAPAFSEAIPLEKDEVRDDVVIILRQSFTVYGRVVDGEGKPRQHIFVGVRREIPGTKWDRFNSMYQASLPRTDTDENGFFRLTGIPLGGGELEFSFRQDPYHEKVIVLPVGRPGEERDLGAILFEDLSD